MIQVKMNYNNDIKRCAIPKTFNELLENIKNNFKLSPNENSYLDIKYIDDEGDQVVISNEFDYDQAVNFIEKSNLNIMKINILLKDMNSLDDIDKAKSLSLNLSNYEIVENEALTEDVENFLESDVEDKEKKEKKEEKVIEYVNTLTEIQNLNKNLQPVVEKKPVDKTSNASNRKGIAATFLDSVNATLDKQFTKIKSKIEKKVNKFMAYLEENEQKKQKKKEEKKELSKVVHSGYICDGCNANPINGSRFKCAVCEDFDFCENCEESHKESHPHPFIKIRCPERAPVKIACAIIDDNLNLKKEDKEVEKKEDRHIFKEVKADFTEKATNFKGFVEKKRLQLIEIKKKQSERKAFKKLNYEIKQKSLTKTEEKF